MRARILRAVLLAPIIFLTADAQDLFLKLDSYFLSPNSRAIVMVLEGKFQGKDAAVSLGQVTDISLNAPDFTGHAPAFDAIALRTEGKTTIMELQTRGPGTYLLGVSSISTLVNRKAADFNEHLQKDGLPDALSQRRKNNELGKDVRERFSKHVRAVFQVGDKLSDDYKRRLNHPAELIPQQNPYSMRIGQTLAVLCLIDGRPIGNQFVMAGWESGDGKIQTVDARTGADGIVRFKLTGDGKWYVKMNHIKPLTDPNVNYESKSATLTFAVRSKRS